MKDWAELLLVFFGTIGSASGFWAYLQNKQVRKDAQDSTKTATLRLLLGMARNQIIFTGMRYIEQGWVSDDEYDDFMRYLYEPYAAHGGNGLAEKVKNDVSQLPMTHSNTPKTETRKIVRAAENEN